MTDITSSISETIGLFTEMNPHFYLPRKKRADRGRTGGLFPHIQHYVYVAQQGNKFKIGFSKEVKKRLRDIERETGSPLKLLLLFDGYCDLEHKLHEWFKPKKICGEWFFLSSIDLQAIAAEYKHRQVDLSILEKEQVRDARSD